jgi:hypothetical protein
MDLSELKRKLFKLLSIGRFYGKLDEEALAQKRFVDQLRYYSIEGRLKAIWCAICNENSDNKKKLFGIKLQHLGKIRGAPDLVFLWENGSGCIEFKSLKGKQTEDQKIFEEWCRFNNVHYEIVRNPNQAEMVLNKWGILTLEKRLP